MTAPPEKPESMVEPYVLDELKTTLSDPPGTVPRLQLAAVDQLPAPVAIQTLSVGIVGKAPLLDVQTVPKAHWGEPVYTAPPVAGAVVLPEPLKSEAALAWVMPVIVVCEAELYHQSLV